MASQFVELNDAAKLLGLTPDQLVEKRSKGDIHGYRDGGSWKFKMEEVQRFKAELEGGGAESGLGLGDDLDSLIAPDEDGPTVLIDDEAVGQSPETASSTIIGKSGGAPQADSDLKIAADSDLTIPAEVGSELSLDDVGSEISLDAGPAQKGSPVDSDVALVPGVGTDSDVKLVPETGSDKALKGPPKPKAEVLGDSQIKLKSGSSGGTGPVPAESGTSRSLGSDSKAGSGDLDLSLDSELALSDDDEMVLGSSGTGSDLSLNGAADSGINLGSPTDSGLSLEADSGISLQAPTDSGLNLEEEPLEMGGSSISSLELPEDESIELDSGAFDSEAGQNLEKDEDFLLTPSDEMFTDESDSGSQVIALEDSVAFDQDAAALGGAGALMADAGGLEQQLDALGGGGIASTPVGMPAGFRGVMGPIELPYSVWNITGLVMVIMVLSLTGVLMTDMVRNMWAWDQGMDVATSISEGVTAAFGRK